MKINTWAYLLIMLSFSVHSLAANDNIEKKISESAHYADSILNTTDFNKDEAMQIANEMIIISNNKSYSIRNRSNAALVASKILGQIARTDKSASVGKLWLKYIHNSLEIDPNNWEAHRTYVEVISSMVDLSCTDKICVKVGLGIDFEQSALEAIYHIERFNKQNDPEIGLCYNNLKDYVD